MRIRMGHTNDANAYRIQHSQVALPNSVQPSWRLVDEAGKVTHSGHTAGWRGAMVAIGTRVKSQWCTQLIASQNMAKTNRKPIQSAYTPDRRIVYTHEATSTRAYTFVALLLQAWVLLGPRCFGNHQHEIVSWWHCKCKKPKCVHRCQTALPVKESTHEKKSLRLMKLMLFCNSSDHRSKQQYFMLIIWGDSSYSHSFQD